MRRKEPVLNLWPVLGIMLITLASVTACDDKQAMEQQSPVDIAGYTTGSVSTLSFAYTGQAKSLTNTGEFVKVIYEDAGGILLDGHTYQLSPKRTPTIPASTRSTARASRWRCTWYTSESPARSP